MNSFLVLGLVPGTNLQITFQDWLDMLQLAIAASGLAWLYFQHRQFFDELVIDRRPLPASQLHQRLMNSAR